MAKLKSIEALRRMTVAGITVENNGLPARHQQGGLDLVHISDVLESAMFDQSKSWSNECIESMRLMRSAIREGRVTIERRVL